MLSYVVLILLQRYRFLIERWGQRDFLVPTI
nr:MAG TPA: hypothetical protein [Caudoviricetes sp.]DAK84801.1 MAG TPA: hypothetical protein [Caudoviricetes sp.]